MTEKQALKIAEKYVGEISTEDKIKWLSTEVIEVANCSWLWEVKKNEIQNLKICSIFY